MMHSMYFYISAYVFSQLRCIIKSFQLFFACWVIFIIFFKNQLFQQQKFTMTLRLSNSLYPDQARHFVGPDQGSNCLRRLSANNTSRHGVLI